MMKLWKFHTGPRAGETAVLLSSRMIESAGGGLHMICELLVAGDVIEFPEAALKEVATPVEAPT